MITEHNDCADPLIDEVRGRRRELCAKYGNDLHKLCEAIRALEARHPEKVIDRSKLKSVGAQRTAES